LLFLKAELEKRFYQTYVARRFKAEQRIDPPIEANTFGAD